MKDARLDQPSDNTRIMTSCTPPCAATSNAPRRSSAGRTMYPRAAHRAGAPPDLARQLPATHHRVEDEYLFPVVATDGNGRVGQALIHTVLTWRGLTPTAVLPVSLVLATRRDEYVEGLTAYRGEGSPCDTESARAAATWIRIFVSAAQAAADQSATIVDDIASVQQAWQRRLGEYRRDLGLRALPPADSATARILDMSPAAPVLTSRTVQRMLDVSPKAGLDALDELRQAEVLTTRGIARGATAYLADELLDPITYAERRMASTKFDTRVSPPNPPVPARPARD